LIEERRRRAGDQGAPHRPAIFIPQPIPETALARLEEIGDVTLFSSLDRRITPEEVLESVPDKEILFALGSIPYDDAVIDAATRLQLIAAMHPAAPFVDVAAATRRKILVTGIPNTLADTTAEFTFVLLLSTAWLVPQADRMLREGRWCQNQSMALLTTRLAGKTVGIVGMGRVGVGVAKRLQGMEMRILYNKRSRLSAEEEAALGAEFRELDDLFRESDFVVLTPLLTAETKGMVDARRLSLMKPAAILVNTSRGPVVDEAALEAALREGGIAGAGLDVFEAESRESGFGPRAGLLELPNVVLTPHYGSAARETREEMANRVVDNIELFLTGERPLDVLNPELYDEPSRRDERIG